MASCTFVMIASYGGDVAAQSRVLQGLVAGIGFVGGGAILKDGLQIKGTATAASVLSAAALGAAIAMNRFGIAVSLTILNLLALRALMPLKNKLDREPGRRDH
jgi:putative Mg2+ transporter-C (MgtC) family protein